MKTQKRSAGTFKYFLENVYARLRNVFKERLKYFSQGTFFKRFYGKFNTGSNEEARHKYMTKRSKFIFDAIYDAYN